MLRDCHCKAQRVSCFCVVTVPRGTVHLSGFLAHIRDHVDGIVAVDGGMADAERALLREVQLPVSILPAHGAHAPERPTIPDRDRILAEAAASGASWVLCGSIDERFDPAFLARLPDETERGMRRGEPVRCIRLVHLWDSLGTFRADGPLRPRWTTRLFRLPKPLAARPDAARTGWLPPELAAISPVRMDGYVHKLSTLDPLERRRRFGMDDKTGVAIDLQPVPLGREPLVATCPSFIIARHQASPDEFDETHYLSLHPDVSAAVAQGVFENGWDHFRQFGAAEGRHWRKRGVLHGLDFAGILARRRAALT